MFNQVYFLFYLNSISEELQRSIKTYFACPIYRTTISNLFFSVCNNNNLFTLLDKGEMLFKTELEGADEILQLNTLITPIGFLIKNSFGNYYTPLNI